MISLPVLRSCQKPCHQNILNGLQRTFKETYEVVGIHWVSCLNLDRLGNIDPMVNVELDCHWYIDRCDDPQFCRVLEGRDFSILIIEV